MKSFAVLLLTLFGLVNSAKADVILEIGNVSTTAGTNGVLVPVMVRTTTASPSHLTGFNLIFDVSPSGTGLPAGITFAGSGFNTTGATLVPSILNSNPLAAPALNADLVLNAGGIPLGTTTTNQTVFNLVFNVESSAPAGTYAVNFSRTDATEFNITQSPLGAFQLINGSIMVVPEPSSSLAVVGLGSTLLLRRRKLGAA